MLTPQEFENVVKREQKLYNKNPWREKSIWKLVIKN